MSLDRRDDHDCAHIRHRPVSQRSEPLRLALLAPTLAPAGGLCRWSREFVRSLEAVADADTIHIDVLVRNQLDVGQATVDAYGLRCDLHDLPPDGTSTRRRLRTIQRVGRLIASLEPDVIHTPLDWLWMLADPRAAFRPIAAMAHSEPSPQTMRPEIRLIARRLSSRGSLTLIAAAPSLRPALDTVTGASPGTAVALPVATDLTTPNGDIDDIDLRGALGIRPGESVVATLSRLIPSKRVDIVLDIVELARSDGRPLRFVVCGDGPDLEPLVARAQQRQMDGWIHFLGHVPDPGRILAHSDVVLHPSESEGGQPFALIEALLAGVPVVAAAAGGAVDLVADQRDGRLVPIGDTDGLYRALCETLDDGSDRAERTGRAERRFDLHAMGVAHLELIEQLATRRGRRR